MGFFEMRYLFLILLTQSTFLNITAEESYTSKCNPIMVSISVISYFAFCTNTSNLCTGNNSLAAYISENNLHGEISFRQSAEEDIITVTALVKSLSPETIATVSWNIRQLPVDYTTLDQRCTNNALGPV